MKKKAAILFIFVLSLFTVYQISFAANITAGIVTGGIGTVTVKGATSTATLTLYKQGSSTSLQSKETSDGNAEFSGIEPGIYIIEATTADGDSSKSNPVKVKPGPVTISSTDGTDEITVSGGTPGATFTLYNPNIPGFVPKTIVADANGNAVFKNLPAGKGYQVSQTVNGAEGDLSTDKCTIRPSQVTVVITNEAGFSNNQGEITVTNTAVGNILSLYKSSGELAQPPVIVTSPSGYTFSGLSAGEYYVVQTQNGVQSLDSKKVTLSDQQIPVIKLKGDNPVKIVYSPDHLDYQEPGAIVVDNIDPERTISIADNPIPSDSLPGIYTLRYNAVDNNGNKADEVTRTVIIAPNAVTLEATNTDPATPTDAVGEIKVTDVVPGSTIYLYQDIGDDNDETNDILIRVPIQNATEGMVIYNIPVGNNYYIIQEYGTIRSLPSNRVNILDKTPPVLTLNGSKQIILVAGDTYTEQGASATDNIDSVGELHVVITGEVNTTKPGKYEITYSVIDKSDNGPVSVKRTVIVYPQAVIAIGSTADLGEVGVKNALTGTTLKLHNSDHTLYEDDDNNGDGAPDRADGLPYTLKAGETTYVFKNVRPGNYYVTQTFTMEDGEELESAISNVVDVIDVDRPYITLNGPEKLSFVWDEDKAPYFKGNVFKDPGATAKDYIDDDNALTERIETKLIRPNSTKPEKCDTKTKCDITFSEPGVYTIIYSVEAERGTKADNQMRTITVAPAKVDNLEAGTSKIITSDVYSHSGTIVQLYNTRGQLINSKNVVNSTSTTFENVPSGLGYYVTQTVNGVESAPSEPVNVSVYPDADMTKFIGLASFQFLGDNAIGIIDQVNNTITVTVPKGTDVTQLKASFTTIQENEVVKVNRVTQMSNISIQDFSTPVNYTVSLNGESKTYKVLVTEENDGLTIWPDALTHNISITDKEQAFTLAAAEQRLAIAEEKGINFIADDLSIHITLANIKESKIPSLKIKKVKNDSFVSDHDPNWSSYLTNLIEINWGESSDSFIQPLEVVLPNPDNQAFARLVRENGELYAIIQPSERKGKNLIGLATKPGVYALVDGLSEPKIDKQTEDRKNFYTIDSPISNTEVYYTIDDRQITFERSARNDSLSSYLFSGQLSNWKKYESTISGIQNDKLYAIVIKDQVISPVAAIEPSNVKERVGGTVSRNKVWSIRFNAKVDKRALFSNVIYITDENGVRVPTLLALSDDEKTIKITPAKAYEANKLYTLWIEKQIKESTFGKFLKQPIKMTFMTK